MMFPLLLSLGVLFFLALGLGRLCARISVPRVTGYLLVGLLAGPSVAHSLGIPSLITRGQLSSLDPLHHLTLGLIVLVIGGNFHFRMIRRSGARLLRLSAIEMSLTALLVGGSTFFAGASPIAACFFAIMAITTAPAATQMVVREYESEGPLTDTMMPLIGMNNLTAIIVFILFANSTIQSEASVSKTVFQVLVPIGLGILSGTVLSVMDQRLTKRVERQILVLASVAALVGICFYFEISSMLATLIAGAVLVNASPHGRRILRDLSAVDYPLYVIFFIMAGAHLHLDYLSHIGFVGAIYVVARLAGKAFGCWVGAHSISSPGQIRTWLGPAMLAQAGLAIGLASTLARDWGIEGKQVQSAVLASVVVFEGIGPLLTRIALIRAGEVTILKMLTQRSPVGYAEGMHQVINHFRNALGIRYGKSLKNPSEIQVKHVMRKNVEVVQSNLSFNGVLKAMGNSRYDRLPVVNRREELVGVIQYSDISEILFDRSLRNLIVAGDIANPEHFALSQNDSLKTALNGLKVHPDHTYLLVVDEDNPKKLVGVVRHNEVLSAQRRKQA